MYTHRETELSISPSHTHTHRESVFTFCRACTRHLNKLCSRSEHNSRRPNTPPSFKSRYIGTDFINVLSRPVKSNQYFLCLSTSNFFLRGTDSAHISIYIRYIPGRTCFSSHALFNQVESKPLSLFGPLSGPGESILDLHETAAPRSVRHKWFHAHPILILEKVMLGWKSNQK